MKKFYFFYLCSILLGTLQAQSPVRALGNDDFNWPSEGITAYNSIAKDNADNIYVAFQDGAHDNKITVRKYDGISWKTVGQEGFSAGEAKYTTIALTGAGVPYVAYQDVSISNKAVVKRFNGSAWVTVGTEGFSAGIATNTFIAIDGEDNIYVVYQDNVYSGKATLRKYNGTTWILVGGAGFSPGAAGMPRIAFNSTNIPYVAYRDVANSTKISVMRYNSSWENVGAAGFSDGGAFYTTLAIGLDNTPYVAYQDNAHDNKISVKKLAKGFWQNVGDEGFSNGTADYVNIAISNNGTPYIAFTDRSTNKIETKKYVNDQWVSEGSGNYYISEGEPSYTGMILDSDDLPIVGFVRGKATVAKYNNSGWKLLGGDGIQSLQSGEITNIIMDDAGTPYIGWENYSGPAKLSVSKFNGNDWQYHGNPQFSGGAANWQVMAINDAGELHIAYADYALEEKLTVKKLAGGIWQTLGTATVSEGRATFMDYKIDKSGTSYIAYMDDTYENKIVIKKFANGAWQYVGTPGSAGSSSSARFSLALDSEGTPYLAYANSNNDNKATLKKFNSNNNVWQFLPYSDGFSDGFANHIQLVIDNNDVLSVCFSDWSVDGKATVMKYNGSSWSTIGAKGFTNEEADFTRIAIDPAGNLVLLYGIGYNGKINVKKYKSGLGWADMGNTPFSAGRAWWPKLTLDNTGTPWVTYMNREYNYAYVKTLDIQLPTAYKQITAPLAIPNTGIFLDDGELLCLVKPINNVGNTNARVWVDGTQPVQFVKRHYQLMTVGNGQQENPQARVTLYFTNDDFKSFNNQTNPPALLLPNADDPASVAERKANLLIEKRGGISSDNSGSPFTYPGEPVNINPADEDIIWNSTFKRWEISFEVTGFSGFFVKTTLNTLPVKWISVNAVLNTHQQPFITWKVQESSNNYFSVEYSRDGIYFTTAGMVNSKGDGVNSYSFTHENNIAAKTYYRIRQTDKDGTHTYSKIIFIQPGERSSRLTVYPNPGHETINISVSENYLTSKAILINSGGIVLQQIQLSSKNVTVDMKQYTPGIYILRMHDGRAIKIMKK